MSNKLTKNDSNNTWYGYLFRWGDEIPERPGQRFKFTDRATINAANLFGRPVVGVKGTVWNIQKANEEGVFVVVASDEDLTDYKIGYNLTSDDEIEDEHPYDAVSGEVRYKLRKYPIKEIVLKKSEPADASPAAIPVNTSLTRPKRT